MYVYIACVMYIVRHDISSITIISSMISSVIIIGSNSIYIYTHTRTHTYKHICYFRRSEGRHATLAAISQQGFGA